MREISRRKSEFSRVDEIRAEMASAVRLLGDGGRNADEQNAFAARRAGLARTVIERLRWKKMKRVPADIADAMRDALAAHQAKEEARLKHELHLTKLRLNALERSLDASDQNLHRAPADGPREPGR